MSYNDLPHLRSNTYSEGAAAKPTVAAGAGLGGSPSGLANAGRDEFGTISATTGTTPPTGTLFTLTFAQPYSVAPDAVIVNDNLGCDAFATATTTTLTITSKNAAAAASSLKVSYLVVGGA